MIDQAIMFLVTTLLIMLANMGGRMTEADKIIKLYYLYNFNAGEIYSKIKTEHPWVTMGYVQAEVDSLDDELDSFINDYGVIVYD